MSKDLNKRRYRKLYRPEFEVAREVLSGRKGTLEWSPHDYEAFTWVENDVRLVFYPHRTSAWNYHLRVRDGGSKSKVMADLIMRLLDDSVSGCTFSRTNHATREAMRRRSALRGNHE